MNNWFALKHDEKKKAATVRIFDQIGTDWFGEGTNAKNFTDAVDELGELELINLHINSPGGNVYEGLAIYNYLRRHDAEVHVYVDGIAASIASIIAMAGDRIVMPENTNMFIHNPWTFAGGDATSLRKTADELDSMRSSLLGIYMQRSNLSEEDVVAMMDGETLLTAEEAVEWGFATELEEASKMAADVSPRDTVAVARMEAEAELRLRSMQAQIDARDEEITSLKEVRDALQDDLEIASEMNRKLTDERGTAMASREVIDTVLESGGPEWLATALIVEDASEGQVKAALSRFQGVRDACSAAGIPEDGEKILAAHWDDQPAMISALLLEALASAGEEIKNRLKADQGDQAPFASVKYESVYASRNSQN